MTMPPKTWSLVQVQKRFVCRTIMVSQQKTLSIDLQKTKMKKSKKICCATESSRSSSSNGENHRTHFLNPVDSLLKQIANKQTKCVYIRDQPSYATTNFCGSILYMFFSMRLVTSPMYFIDVSAEISSIFTRLRRVSFSKSEKVWRQLVLMSNQEYTCMVFLEKRAVSLEMSGYQRYLQRYVETLDIRIVCKYRNRSWQIPNSFFFVPHHNRRQKFP